MFEMILFSAALERGAVAVRRYDGCGTCASAGVTGSATIIDPLGITPASLLLIPSIARPAAADVSISVTSGVYTINAQQGQVVSVDVSHSVPMTRRSSTEALTAEIRSVGGDAMGGAADPRTRSLQVRAALVAPRGTEAGLYSGSLQVIVNLN